MAKRVIQMYDKYKSTTKTYPKIIKECLQDDVLDLIEGQVEANPTLAGTEASLTGLQIGDTKYAVPQGTTVVANPTLAGTEADLEGLQVGDTKYKVGGGKQLYQHNIRVKALHVHSGSYYYLSTGITIINDSNVSIDTFEKLYSYLTSKGYTSINSILTSVNGRFIVGQEYYLNGIYANGNNQIVVLGFYGSNNSTTVEYVQTDFEEMKETIVAL